MAKHLHYSIDVSEISKRERGTLSEIRGRAFRDDLKNHPGDRLPEWRGEMAHSHPPEDVHPDLSWFAPISQHIEQEWNDLWIAQAFEVHQRIQPGHDRPTGASSERGYQPLRLIHD